MTELPPYTVRISARAKRLQLKVSGYGEVVVVVPRRMDPRHGDAFVARHAAWLRETLAGIAPPGKTELLPTRIALPALDRVWDVRYESATASCRDRLAATAATLQVPAGSSATQRALLQAWLSRQAKAALPPRLERLSRELGLPYAKVTVRAQKTRWGSCSARHHISLNRNLLFLEPELVRYLFIHELCHTVHLNHSPRYWALVATFAPDYRDRERALGHAMQQVPRWAAPGR
ncbi:MAG TPA: M48 family peptidase [Gammaproteobacteria bacterium]|nr:M48 family peptidase [Gammaproteobacteria bacterium]